MANNPTKKNKTALTGVAAKRMPAAPVALAAAAPAAPALSEDFDEEESAPPAAAPAPAPTPDPEPEVRTRKDAIKTRKDQAAERVKPAVLPRDDYVYDKSGAVKKDEDGDDMRLAAGEHERIGFVTESGVLFPNGFKYKGGHVMNGVVVLNRCPRCGHHQSIDAALSGSCDNQKAGVDRLPCGFSKHEELEEFDLK